MTIWWMGLIVVMILAGGLGFIWIALKLNHLSNISTGGAKSHGLDPNQSLEKLAEEETSHLFNKEFREELRNRGRLRFESIINENAMFLQQDLRLTTSQLNEYMKKQISAKLDSEFDEYAKAMQDLQELAKKSLAQATSDVEKQRVELAQSLEKEIAERKQSIMRAYEANMAEVIEHYLTKSLGETLDFKAQLPYIIEQMEKNKQNIAEDMKL